MNWTSLMSIRLHFEWEYVFAPALHSYDPRAVRIRRTLGYLEKRSRRTRK